ncbi:hypothetical protein J1N35_001779 [Gossypium stocksii]|uniref:Uncharacterized protein n=1 Tax=Gossypium stocksii TaxID=47602 RepID=A0A9D3WL43_9ROSI|nr:hypothetical protein J1N35_001779 [Gossypium stocksii]
MGVDPSDLLNQGLYEEPESDLIILTLTEREEREEAREWSAKRDKIEQTMCTDYMARNIRYGNKKFCQNFADIDLDDGNQESVIDDQIKFVGEQLGKIANDKTPHLYEEVMSMEVEGFDDDILCFVFDYLVSHEYETKAFLVKSLRCKCFIVFETTHKQALPLKFNSLRYYDKNGPTGLVIKQLFVFCLVMSSNPLIRIRNIFA